MDYVDKEEIREVIERCGGRVTGSVSKKTTHLIAGRDSGPSKVLTLVDEQLAFIMFLDIFLFIRDIKSFFIYEVTRIVPLLHAQ